jgi:signal peptidase I
MGRIGARVLFGCIALVVGAVAWMGLAPAALGGGITYATVTGSSMEPELHQGDLVMLRSASAYRVGDVVGYHDPNVNRLVLHRIIAEDEAGFTLQGDNNDFLDPVRPQSTEIVGRLWTSVPEAGSVVGRFRHPGSAAVLVGALVLLPTGPRRRRRPDDGLGATSGPAAPPRPSHPRTAPPSRDLEGRRGMVAALTVLAVALAALAGYAYSRPASETVTIPDAYEQTGSFGYTAEARVGAAYPDGVVRTGEAVFPRLSETIEMSFDYRVVSDEKTDLTGRGALAAVVSDGLGWSRSIPLAPARAFRGEKATLTGTLHLDRLRSVVRAFERETGTKATGYSVDITPRVSIEGEVGGSPVSSVLSSSFSMRLDGTRLALGTSPTGEPVDLVARRNGGIAREGNASLSLAGVALPVYQARAIGLLGFEIAFGAALLLALPMIMAARRSEAGAIRMRMGGRLVDVADLPTSAPGGCIDLERMSDLARVADRADMPIMVAETATRARYAVVWGNVLYRYTTRPVVATPHRGPVPVVARA